MLKKEEEIRLLTKLKEGSQEAMKEVYTLLYDKVYKSAYNILRNEQDAEDIRQNVFANLWADRETLEIQSLSGYLTVTARNQALNILKQQKVQQKYREAHNIEDVTQQPAEVKESGSMSKEQQLMAAVDNMPPMRKHVITEFWIEEKKRKDIAASSNVKVTTVDTHLRKARKFLEKLKLR